MKKGARRAVLMCMQSIESIASARQTPRLILNSITRQQQGAIPISDDITTLTKPTMPAAPRRRRRGGGLSTTMLLAACLLLALGCGSSSSGAFGLI